MTTLLIFLAVISFLIAIHEAGHLISAKLSNVWVHEFSIGFGPSLVSRKFQETTYSLKPIPFGGYVKMAGEDVGEEAEKDEKVPEERKFYSQKPFTKMLISASGPIMNVLAAVLIMIVIVGLTGTPRISIYGFMEGSPSEQHLELGDQIIAVEGERVTSTGQLNAYLQESGGEPVTVTVLRDGEELNLSLSPEYYQEEGRYMLGVMLGTAMGNEVVALREESALFQAGLRSGDKITAINNHPVREGATIASQLEKIGPGEQVEVTVDRQGEELSFTVPVEQPEEVFAGLSLRMFRDRVGPFRAVTLGTNQISALLVMTYRGIQMIIRGEAAAGDAVTGPVGIANILGESARRGVYSLFFMISLISLNLGLINLVPFPALDGSRIGYAVYELIRGKPIPPEKEGLINSIGFIILIGLMVFITYRDIIRFFT